MDTLQSNIEKDLKVIAALQRDLNLVTAFLLMTGQITIIGIFVTPGEFSLSLSGPILGRARLESKYNDQKLADSLIDVIDILIIILLLIDEIRVSGAVIGPARLSIIVSGPIFGSPKYEPTLPGLKREYNFYKKIVSKYFQVDPELFNNDWKDEI